jgi:hypothetical protein
MVNPCRKSLRQTLKEIILNERCPRTVFIFETLLQLFGGYNNVRTAKIIDFAKHHSPKEDKASLEIWIWYLLNKTG